MIFKGMDKVQKASLLKYNNIMLKTVDNELTFTFSDKSDTMASVSFQEFVDTFMIEFNGNTTRYEMGVKLIKLGNDILNSVCEDEEEDEDDKGEYER